jgi:hypothetical protein
VSAQKTLALPQFLTRSQIYEASNLFKTYGDRAVEQIQAQVIEPNMATINAKLGQENDPKYLAYAVVYVLSQAREAQS